MKRRKEHHASGCTSVTPEGLVGVAVSEDRLAEVPGERGHGGGCGGGGGAGETEQLVAVVLPTTVTAA